MQHDGFRPGENGNSTDFHDQYEKEKIQVPSQGIIFWLKKWIEGIFGDFWCLFSSISGFYRLEPAVIHICVVLLIPRFHSYQQFYMLE